MLSELVGELILSLVGNVNRNILSWFSSLPTFSLKHKGYYHLSTLCVHTEKNCTLRTLHIFAKRVLGDEEYDINFSRWV